MNKLAEDPNIADVLKEPRGYYSEAYSEIYVHEGMLRDRVRTMAYKRAIEMNKHLFKVSNLLFSSHFLHYSVIFNYTPFHRIKSSWTLVVAPEYYQCLQPQLVPKL